VRSAALPAALHAEEVGIVDCRVESLRSRVAALARGINALDGSGAPRVRVEEGAGGRLRLTSGEAFVYETADEGDLLCSLELQLESEKERLLVGRTVFHAAVVTSESGALAVFGRTMAGKTTLVTALVELGFSYVTDDSAIVNEDGTISPYPRPLNLRSGASALLGTLGGRFERVDYTVERGSRVEYLVPTAAATASGPCRPSLVAFLERDRSELAIASISAAEATARILEHTLRADPPSESLRRGRRLVESAPSRAVIRGGDPRAIAAALRGLLTGPSPGPRTGPAFPSG
jgi:hypothetical protein